MQTITSSTRQSLGGLVWRTLLLLLVFGIGSFQAAIAQTTVTADAITLNVKGTSTTYNTQSTTAGPGVFSGANIGTFNLATASDVLALNGATLTINDPTGNYNDGQLLYRIYQTGTTAPGFTNVSLGTGTLNNGVRTFTVNGLTTNLLTGLTGGSGTGYNFDVIFRANDNNSFNPSVVDTPIKTATFTVTGAPIPAPTLNPNNIQLAADGATVSTSYYFPNTGTTPQFPGFNFTSSQNAGGTSGAFDINNGQLRLTNTSATTTEAGANTVSGVVLYYRVRSTSSGGGAFQPITLSQSGTTSSSGSRTFIIDPTNASNTNPQPNLVAAPAVTGVGNYAVDVYYQASGVNSSTGTPFTITYPPTGYSTATFTVGGTPIATTIWTGAVNDNWFDANNWTAGIPNANTNALVRDLGSGNNVPYPNIRSDIRYTTSTGALIYDNTGSGPAKTFNFTMGGTSQASRSIARLVNGQLQVFGNFDNSYDSFIQRENTIMEFAGVNQTITGGSFVRVDISGGGNKVLGVPTGLSNPKSAGVMNVSEALNFLTPNVYTTAGNTLTANPYTTLSATPGILSTDISSPATNLIVLADRASTNSNNGAQLNGETDAAFVYGFIRTTRQGVMVGEARTYGKIGLDLTFNGANSPGNVEITRNTVEAYAVSSTRFSVRRIFGVRPSDQATGSGGLNATMVFHYRDAETMNLNGPSTTTSGTGSIPEDRLTIFVSTNSGNTFTLVGRDGPVDQTNNTVTRTGVTTFATFTLGDTQNPLPVQLSAFNVARSGSNALLTWATASEQDNKGFNVQVSADGATFSTLGFVASKSSNSVEAQSYSFTDKETNKAGTRYYRLEQVDLSGKTSYSPVRAVNFDGEVASTATLVAYPNPFNGSDLVGLSLQGATPTDGVAYVKLVDMAGRTVRDQKISLTNSSLSLGDVSELRSGLYVAKVTLPDGTTQTVRIQKQ